jgi:hypothetical protein
MTDSDKTLIKRLLLVILACTVIIEVDKAHAGWEFAPYAVGSLDYQINSLSSEYLRTDCKGRVYLGNPGGEYVDICRGRNPLGELQIGVEFAPGSWREKWYVPVFRAGWRHRSHLPDGVPFNNRPEVASEAIMFELKIGGLR